MRKLGKKTIIPLVIAMGLVFGGAAGAFALGSSGLAFESEDYTAWFYLNHLQVHLLENGRDVCGGHNTLDGTNKVSGELVQHLGYSRSGEGEILGNVEPGKLYKEEIAARNGQDIPVYLRLTVKKYWMVTDEDRVPQGKAPALSPKLIRLSAGGKTYNSSDWFLNPKESTDEQETYYYRKQLAAGADTEPLFDSLVIDPLAGDKELLEKEEVSREKKGDVTVIKYRYKYDDYAFYIKADVQAIQTHNANDAIRSQWGVGNITEGSDKASLKLK